MRTFDLAERKGEGSGFQIRSLVGRWRASRAAGDIAGARVIRWPKRWAWSDDEFCEFEVDGVRFVILEPFGDSSRFWIVSQTPTPQSVIDRIRANFANAPVLDWRLGSGGLTRRGVGPT